MLDSWQRAILAMEGKSVQEEVYMVSKGAYIKDALVFTHSSIAVCCMLLIVLSIQKHITSDPAAVGIDPTFHPL